MLIKEEFIKTCYNFECRGNENICMFSGDKCKFIPEKCGQFIKYYQNHCQSVKSEKKGRKNENKRNVDR